MINWTLRDIQILLALAETMSFRRTAERVHLSQPAVSGVVARIESALGTTLFERSTRSVRLTEAGEALVTHVRMLHARAVAAEAAVRDVVELRQGRVRVAALPSLAASIIPAVLAQFASRHPGVRVDVFDQLSVPSFELVRAGEVDFALTAENPEYSDLSYTPLASDPLVLLLRSDHPLAAGRSALRWEQVVQLPHISMPPPTSVRQYADAALLQISHRFEPRYEVEHLATINAMVAAGLGVSALPELAALVARGPNVVLRRLVAPAVRRPIGLVRLKERRLSLAAQGLASLLEQEVLRLLRSTKRPAGAR
ncbi:MAG: LysR family transcriptional regulator [Burkholderiaceae bacterium]